MNIVRLFLALLLFGYVTLVVSADSQVPSPTSFAVKLGPPPTAPAISKVAAATLEADGQTGFSNFLNAASRETSREFYNLVFGASENVPMDWSGSFAGCIPGTNSTTYLEAVMRRVNYFRAMAGIPSSITFSNEYTRKAQLAALIMGANNSLSHFPPVSWSCYTADGYEAAGKSNLSLGSAGPQAVVGQVQDNGANNTAAGHRRWILYPQTRVMGSGNVSATGPNSPADSLWVFDPFYGTSRPATRDNFVSWPPPGFVPYPVVYARWSFSYPDADFSSATASVTSNGVPLSVAREAVTNGFGENTLVWVPAGLDPNNLTSFSRPASDTVYHVTLNNVIVSGAPRSFSYDVTVFDPAVAGTDYHPALITGPSQPVMLASNVYGFTAVSNASRYEWRQSRVANLSFTDGAETGLTNFIVQAATNLYNVRDSAVHFSGSYSFHLTHTQTVSQILTLNRLLLVTASSSVTFESRLGYATADQVARVQVSTDEGGSWTDVYTQPGSGGSGEASFNLRTVSLGSYAGRTLRLRLNYYFDSGSYYPQIDLGVGWYIDDLTLLNCQEVLSSAIASANTNRTFLFAPTNSGPFLLEVRPLLFGDYPAEWGPSMAVTSVPNVRVTSIQPIASSSTLDIDFSVVSGSPSSFELWSAPTIDGTFSKEQSAIVQIIVPGSQYRAVTKPPVTQKFYRIRVL